ncbi:histidine kinase [Spongiactinospora rosea]|uniref:Histidine kinase n=1 Tax=Spongiactinospora rosea TaxID=2248750 RepID=A0A366M0X4_9ACTN|nr:histidine kinase [Spongiactinospora rosea]RBQ19450.1 histidine kinase [Spongiactinospora rosea]
MREGPIERGTGLGVFRRYTWWSLTGTVTLFLLLFGKDWIADPALPPWGKALAAVALAAMVTAAGALLHVRLPRAGDGRAVHPPLAWLIAGSLAAAVLAAIPLALGDHRLWPLAPALMISITAMFVPPPRRRTLIAAAVVAAAALGGVSGLASADGWRFGAAFSAGLVAFTAWTTLGMLWAWDVAERLDHARDLAAELAVKDERLRFAADLHDIQGHHLQVIALKSELAARLVDRDPARAAAEMMEVRRLSAEALDDTRAVVQGYRRTTLEAEIANAAKVLAAAEIDTRMEHLPDTGSAELPEPARHLLGLVMREATTNVLRHSRARHAEVTYHLTEGTAHLRMTNDGATGLAEGSGAGTGLAGLGERLEAVGGTLVWERDGDRFEVAASLPVGASR